MTIQFKIKEESFLDHKSEEGTQGILPLNKRRRAYPISKGLVPNKVLIEKRGRVTCQKKGAEQGQCPFQRNRGKE